MTRVRRLREGRRDFVPIMAVQRCVRRRIADDSHGKPTKHFARRTPAAARTEGTKSPSSPTSSDHGYSSGDSILTGSSSIEPTSHDTYTATSALASSDVSQPLDGALPSDKCDGTQVASCLENGCSRSFGGNCNCALNCHCIRRASDSAAAPPVAEDTDPFSTISLKRYVLQIEPADHGLGIDTILALISVGDGIRSVHDVSDQPLPSTSGHFERPRNSHLVILRSEKTVDISAALTPLKKLEVPWYILEHSEIRWARKEVVVRVDEMMCPGNCGRTVVNAIRTVKHVETANLVFEVRQVVVRGRMDPNELCDAIQGVGFGAQLDAVTPLPNRFRFCVKELVDVAFVGKRLEHTLKHVDGVESVVINVELADVLVIAMLDDASSLLQAATRSGLIMVEIPDSATTFAVPNSELDHVESTSNMVDEDGRHVCDIKICPHNNCQQYMATVAHTAALAVGWSVPGCAMTWGGECTCGEKCKCSGCPMHNPST
ncbi:hypothetical protein FI667_g4808, partial [Globisporangium splendens]